MGATAITSGTARRRWIALATAALLVIGAACSSGDDDPGGDPDGDAADAPGTSEWERPACELPEAASVEVDAAPVADVPGDVDITSFDGISIRAHWFPVDGSSADDPRPTILMGPGWGQPGDTSTDAVGLFGVLNIASLWDAGYNVLTWDPRGFGASTGKAQVDSPDFEGRDVQYLLTWLADQPGVALDADGDATAGMVGGSYGGGIQLVTAALDCRVDALVPVIAWHSLGTSLYRNDTFKQGWSEILTQAARDSVDPHVTDAYDQGADTGVISEENSEWFLERGPGELVADIQAPTLLVGGTVDTLFTLDENVANHELLREAGTPTAMVWQCGGHGVCLTDPGDPAVVDRAIMAWLARYVRGDTAAEPVAPFTFVDQHGDHHVADAYPPAPGDPVEAEGSGRLDLVAEGGAGPITLPEGNEEMLGPIVEAITPGRADNAVEVAVEVDDEAMIVGAPELTISYSGTVGDGERPTRVFAQLVDDASGLVVGNQITPVPVTLDGGDHELTIPIETIAHRAAAGSTLTLQIVATTPAYGEPRLGGEVDFADVHVSLPTVTDTSPLD
jgi:ABC-2 type transport system ATP-binding protein